MCILQEFCNKVELEVESGRRNMEEKDKKGLHYWLKRKIEWLGYGQVSDN